MADDELDALYWVPPDQFTAERTRLSAAAKKRGDADAAKLLLAARKPTTAAWIVNRLVIGRREAQTRLAELGDGLRTAHAAMEGARIRELSARQHQLINELTEAAFDAADMQNPSSTVRDDIAGTLQAAIADPEVRARSVAWPRPNVGRASATSVTARPCQRPPHPNRPRRRPSHPGRRKWRSATKKPRPPGGGERS